jgi:hypothetical protein
VIREGDLDVMAIGLLCLARGPGVSYPHFWVNDCPSTLLGTSRRRTGRGGKWPKFAPRSARQEAARAPARAASTFWGVSAAGLRALTTVMAVAVANRAGQRNRSPEVTTPPIGQSGGSATGHLGKTHKCGEAFC